MIDTIKSPAPIVADSVPPGTTEVDLPYLAEGAKRKETKVDKLNEQMATKAFDDEEATHVKVLHPTKGYRKVSIKRMLLPNSLQERLNLFYNTLAKAAKAKGEAEGKASLDG